MEPEPIRDWIAAVAGQLKRHKALPSPSGYYFAAVDGHELFWATTLTQRQVSTRLLWKAAHHRWDIENDCFNTLSTHWGLDHCFTHEATAIVNFVLTLFLAYVLLQCFWTRNLKPAARTRWATLISLAEQLHRTLDQAPALWLSPWHGRPNGARGPFSEPCMDALPAAK